MNKLRYAKEGARDIMDRTCADLPWQVWLEVDGKDIQIPKVDSQLQSFVISIIFFHLSFIVFIMFNGCLLDCFFFPFPGF